MNRASAASTPAWIFLIGVFGLALAAQEIGRTFIYDHGGIIRGNPAKREIALVFTGDAFADGGGTFAKCWRSSRSRLHFSSLAIFTAIPTLSF
jgi:hypothetical protein